MGLTMAERKSVTRELAQKYRRGSRRKKGMILDQLMQLNGWSRHHAAWVLRCWGRTVFIWRGGRLVKIVVGRPPTRRTRRRYYDAAVYAALKQIWQWYGWMCGKRLVTVLRYQLAVLVKFGE